MATPPDRYRILESPAGPLALIQSAAGGLRTWWLRGADDESLDGMVEDPGLLDDVANQLARYFGGADVDFSDVPTPDGADFSRRCWEACRSIPRGETRSYGQLAAMAGSSDAARAAGQAMRTNPLPIIVPCHRIVAASGRLHGFGGTCDSSDWRLKLKRQLLELEGALPGPAAVGSLWAAEPGLSSGSP